MSQIFSKIRKYQEIYALLALLLLALVIRLPGITSPLWIDEYISLSIAQADNFLAALRSTDHPPLYFILLRAWISLSDSTPFMRILGLIFGIGSVYLIYVWLKRTSFLAGILGGLMAATTPILVDKSNEIRHYALLTFFTVLCFYLATIYLENKENLRLQVGLVLAMCAIVSVHYVGGFVLVSLAVYLCCSQKISWQNLFKTGRLFILPALLLLGYVFLFVQNKDIFTRTDGSWWIPDTSFLIWLEVILTLTGLPQLTILGSIAAAGVLVSVILLIATPIYSRTFKQGWPLLAAAFTYWATMGIYSALSVPIFLPRQAIPGLIPLLGFTAIQASSIRQKNLRLVVVLLIVSLCLGSTVVAFTQPDTSYQTNWGDVMEIFANTYQDDESVVMIPSYFSTVVQFHQPALLNDNWTLLFPNKYLNVAAVQYTLTQRISEGQTVAYLILYQDKVVSRYSDFTQELQQTLTNLYCPPQTVFSDGVVTITRYDAKECSPSSPP